MPTLKEEWIERIKKIYQRDIFTKNRRFTVRTDFYEAPDEIRYDKEMCFKVLLESNECIWNVPEEIRTNEFLEEIAEKGYKGNILLSRKEWKEEDFDFLKKYLSRFEKTKKPLFDSWVTVNPSGVFANRDMILSLVKDGEFKDKKFLLKNYGKDKEMMFALLDNQLGSFYSVSKRIKNAYVKEKNNVINLLKHNNKIYEDLPEKLKKQDFVLDLILAHSPYLFYLIPEDILNNRDKVFELIKKHKNIEGEHLYDRYKNDYEIATYMIERKGSNLVHFDFIKDSTLLKIAAKTYNNVSYMPATEEYRELIREIVLRSHEYENNINLNYSKGNGSKVMMVKDLFPELLKKGKVHYGNVVQFFKQSEIINEETKEEEAFFIKYKDLWIECVKIDPKIYEPFSDYYSGNNLDMELLFYYVSSSIATRNFYKSYVPANIQIAAQEEKAEIQNYILNEYLKTKLNPLKKSKKMKI